MKYEIKRYLRLKSKTGVNKLADLSHLLAPGKYCFTNNLTTLSPTKTSDKSSRTGRLLSSKLSLVADGGLWSGGSAIIGSANKTIRLIDSERREVLTYFTSRDHQTSVTKKRRLFANHFTTPRMLECTIDGATIEQYITDDHIPTEAVFRRVLVDYERFYTSLKRRGGQVLSHGDLWSGNIVVSRGTQYYIDFETVGERHYLFDIFHYIIRISTSA